MLHITFLVYMIHFRRQFFSVAQWTSHPLMHVERNLRRTCPIIAPKQFWDTPSCIFCKLEVLVGLHAAKNSFLGKVRMKAQPVFLVSLLRSLLMILEGRMGYQLFLCNCFRWYCWVLTEHPFHQCPGLSFDENNAMKLQPTSPAQLEMLPPN